MRRCRTLRSRKSISLHSLCFRPLDLHLVLTRRKYRVSRSIIPSPDPFLGCRAKINVCCDRLQSSFSSIVVLGTLDRLSYVVSSRLALFHFPLLTVSSRPSLFHCPMSFPLLHCILPFPLLVCLCFIVLCRSSLFHCLLSIASEDGEERRRPPASLHLLRLNRKE